MPTASQSVSPLGIDADHDHGAAEGVTGDAVSAPSSGGYPDASASPDRGSSAPRGQDKEPDDAG